jgi:uncharacterized protein YggE
MSKVSIKPMHIGLIATVIIAVAFVSLGIPLSSSSDNNNNDGYAQSLTTQNNSTLYVIGDAQTKVKPDMVTLTLSVETTNATADEALNANSNAMNNTLEALKAAGVTENETSTSFFNISPNYNVTQEEDEDLPPVETRDIISYTVMNSITVDSFNLLNISRWIDTAVQAGVNDISGISFSLSDEKSELIRDELLKEAVENAQNKANIAATALGLEVVGVESVNIERADEIPLYSVQQYFTEEASRAAASDAGPSTPIIAGEQQVTSSVSVTFLIG